jgi:tol-pal system protein YbgF
MKKFILILFISLFANSPIVYGYSQQQSNISSLERIERLERDLTIMQKQFYRGETPKSGIAPNDAANVAGLDARIDSLEEKLRSLTGQLEQLQYNLNNQRNLLDKISGDNDFRFQELEKAKKPVTAIEVDDIPKKNIINDTPKNLGSVKLTEPAPGAPIIKLDENDDDEDDIVTKASEDAPKTNAAQQLYDKSFSYIKSSKFSEAEHGFSDFIKKYESHKLVGNAYFWLGESFFVRKNYDKAAINFLRGYKKAPKGQKASDSLLKLATSLSHLNKTKEACAALSKLSNESSNASAGLKQKIKEENSRIGCK